MNKEQIDAWKKEHAELFKAKYGEETVYLKPFNSKSSSYFATSCRLAKMQSKEDFVEAGELLLRTCYLGGLGELNEVNRDTPEYISLCISCNELFQLPNVSLTSI